MQTNLFRRAKELALALAVKDANPEALGFAFLDAGCYRTVYTHSEVPGVVFKVERADSSDMDTDAPNANRRESDIYRYVISRGVKLPVALLPIYYITPCSLVGVQEYNNNRLDMRQVNDWDRGISSDAESALHQTFRKVYAGLKSMYTDLHGGNIVNWKGKITARDYSGAYVHF